MIALRTAVLAAAVRVRNATAVARLATLHVHALRHPEVVQEAMAVEGEEGTVPLVVAVAAAAVKKLGARSLYLVALPLAANTLFEVTRAEG